MKLSFVIAIFAWINFFGFLWANAFVPGLLGLDVGLIASFIVAFVSSIFQMEGR